MSMEELEKLDEAYAKAEAAKQGGGGGSFPPIPEGTHVKAVICDQKPAIVGEKQTAVCKVTFEVVEPEEYAGRRIFHDLWLTVKNAPYLKRDLTLLGWPGEKVTALMEESDSSLMCCGAELMTGEVEVYTDKNGNERQKTTIAFLEKPFHYTPPQDSKLGKKIERQAEEEEIPF